MQNVYQESTFIANCYSIEGLFPFLWERQGVGDCWVGGRGDRGRGEGDLCSLLPFLFWDLFCVHLFWWPVAGSLSAPSIGQLSSPKMDFGREPFSLLPFAIGLADGITVACNESRAIPYSAGMHHLAEAIHFVYQHEENSKTYNIELYVIHLDKRHEVLVL